MATNVALTGLARDMQARADSGRPIRIGLIGSGEMGTDIVTRVAHMPGIEVGAISELRVRTLLKLSISLFRKKVMVARFLRLLISLLRWKRIRLP